MKPHHGPRCGLAIILENRRRFLGESQTESAIDYFLGQKSSVLFSRKQTNFGKVEGVPPAPNIHFMYFVPLII